MKRQMVLYKKDFPELWTLIIEGYLFWNNINLYSSDPHSVLSFSRRSGITFISDTKTQMKQFIKMILPRAKEVLDDFPNELKLKKEINQLESLLKKRGNL